MKLLRFTVHQLQNVSVRQPITQSLAKVLRVGSREANVREIQRKGPSHTRQHIVGGHKRVRCVGIPSKPGDSAIPSLKLMRQDEVIDHTRIIQLIFGIGVRPANGRKTLRDGSISDRLGIGKHVDTFFRLSDQTPGNAQGSEDGQLTSTKTRKLDIQTVGIVPSNPSFGFPV